MVGDNEQWGVVVIKKTRVEVIELAVAENEQRIGKGNVNDFSEWK